MQRKLRVATYALSMWLCTIGMLASSANSQDASLEVADANSGFQSVAAEMLQNGLQLERDQRWQEAIQHYEKCLKKNRSAVELERRLQISRIHHDVVRRYSDGSFVDSLGKVKPTVALDLFSEVLGKLELNYVEPLNLNELIRHGTAYLEVALTEPSFLATHLSTVDPAKIEDFRANIHKAVIGKDMRNRTDARNMVALVANLAQQQIGLHPTATIHEYVAGSVGLLDPYSGYMTAGELAEVMDQIKGNLIGIGVELWAEKSDLRIIEVFSGSPAAQAGLMAGDYILQVDDAKTVDVTGKKAADLLRGPVNSQVRLLYARNGQPPQSIVVTRRRVDVPSISTADMVDRQDGVAYVRITNFQETTAMELDSALWNLKNQGMRSLIIDLRRNPGGLLDSAVEIADRFLERVGSSAPVAATVSRTATTWLANQVHGTFL